MFFFLVEDAGKLQKPGVNHFPPLNAIFCLGFPTMQLQTDDWMFWNARFHQPLLEDVTIFSPRLQQVQV